MRAESATAVLGSFIAITLVMGALSYPAHPPAETLLAPERDRTLDTTSPVILWTSPAHGEAVYPDADVVIQFNESMNTSSFSYEFILGWDPGMGWSWESSVHENDTVRGTHAPFSPFTDYTFNVTYAEDMAGNPLAPGPVPNPWNWSIVVVIVSTDPADGETDVPLDQDIVVEFSGPADTALIWWQVIPDPGTWVMIWSAGNSVVTMTHLSPFSPCTWYMVEILDQNGFPFPSLVPNPWWFETSCPTRIIRTDPYDGQTEVPLYHGIEVEFSRPMNPGTITWTIGPDPGGWTENWSANDTIVTMSHPSPFLACQVHNVSITGGQDKDGYWLLPGFDLVPNPWSFTTTFEYPCIMRTDPFDGETGVGLWKDIVIEFDEPINVSMPFDFEVTPEVPGTVWMTIWNNDTTVTLNHSLPLVPASQIAVQVIEAYDLDGNPLVQGPVRNPFSFYTNGCLGPWIEETNPAHMEMFMQTDRDIVVIFSETMDTATVTWDVQDLGGPSPIVFTPTWSQTVFPDDTLTLSHVTPFDEYMTYFVLIEGQDLDGYPLEPGPVPNPWSFITTCIMPMIVSTDPAPGEVNVSLDKSIVIEFNEEMQPASFIWNIAPNPGGWTDAWSNNNSKVTLNHSIDFGQCTIYTVQVTQAWDLDGFNILPGPWPNPWSFITACLNPYIVSTDPHDGEDEVPLDHDVMIVFSEPMDTGTVVFELLPPLPLSTSWSGNDTILSISHVDPFLEFTVYSANVSGGVDKVGFPLISGLVPNPWSWTTKPKTPAPPTNVSAFLSGSSLRDVTVTWQLSEDDFPGGNVSYYDIYRGDAYDRDGAGYGLLGSAPSGAIQYVDQLAGLDGNCHYYFVCSAQFGVESNCSENQAGKFTRPLAAGPSLVSIPLIPSDVTIETVLQTVMYDMAWSYDTSSGDWKWHMAAKEYGGLTDLDPTMGLWVNVTEASSLTVAGIVPAQTTIHLRSGWNLISFPSFNSSYTVADLNAELPVERVEGFDASAPPHFLRVLQDSDVLLAGQGYWVKVSTDATWVVSNG